MIRRKWLAIVGVACSATTFSSWMLPASAAVLVDEIYNPGFSFLNTYGIWPGVESDQYAPYGVGHTAPTSQFPVPSLAVPFPTPSPIMGAESITLAQYRSPFGDRFDPDTEQPVPYFFGDEVFEINLMGTDEVAPESTPVQRDMSQFDGDGKAILRFKYRAELAESDPDTEFPELLDTISIASIQTDFPDWVPPEEYDETNTRIFDAPVVHDQGVWATFALSFFDNYNAGGADELRTSHIAAAGTYNPLDGTWADPVNSFEYVELITDGQVHTVEIELNVLTPELREFVDFGNLFNPEDPSYIDNHDTAESLWMRLWGSLPRVVTFDSFELCPLSGCGDELTGDFNDDGKVDAADYTVWRDNFPAVYSIQDYQDWKDNFGAHSNLGGGAADFAPVPEPAALLMLVLGYGLAGSLNRRRA